ncbi:hypothetical protein [Neptunitalea lumnitzerae]|uniref:Uncharacterized protein n=1 Tax=Neptunitalea lumnitzerae TaxID=2965509 RepID=A0ABQ5MKA7_9FLAO|nr:hypothetical protein [Neptunitalea sp. Y10]GLB49840.1 hypothetical protein Y10_22080 [Neptunitalea sp. Y10]
MENNQKNNPKSHGQNTKKEALLSYLESLKKFPNVSEHKMIAKQFGVLNYQSTFKKEAINRVLKVTEKEAQTASMIESKTNVKQKYFCRLKSQLVNQNKLQVVFLGQCKITLSKGVQYVSSDKSLFNNLLNNKNNGN